MKRLLVCGWFVWMSVMSSAAFSNNIFFFGQHVFYPDSYSAISSFAFDGIRIWGNPKTLWRDVEPRQDVYDFSVLDQHVRLAETRGMNVMYTLGQTPVWASARPTELGSFGLGAAAEPVRMSDWSAYVGTVARRYRGRITAYEVMNEPRIGEAIKMYSPGFFSGSTAQLVRMTELAAQAIHAADPQALVVCPAMDGSDLGIKRLDYFLSQGGGRSCDVIGFHFYLKTGSINEFTSLLSQIRQMLVRYKLQDKPVWNTEMGVLVGSSGNQVRAGAVGSALDKVYSDDEAASLMLKVQVASSNGGVARTYWFAHDSSSMGSTLPNKKAGQLNGLGEAYANAKIWFSKGRKVRGCSLSDSQANCAVYEGNYLVGRVVWGIPLVPVEWLTANPMLGKVHLLNGQTINMSSSRTETLSALTRNFADPVFISID
ncbi:MULTISPECIES: cellulase family glycosylhydrolase [Aquitalea]|uniref:endo-1,4-beta-xylanase n=1 Tax=Aquitalea TaxID=407217 RepID=UPI00135A339B|nr:MULTISPECIES: cellulase family glycosylhydrolase [Aquitalea]